MTFWIILCLLLFTLCVIERNISVKYKNIVGFVIFFITWFITAFRSEIGWDYDSYKNTFSTVDIFHYEPGFSAIIIGLREIGCSYQMLFVVVSLISYFLIWKGSDYWIKKYNCLTKGWFAYLYFLFPSLGYASFSIIRQMLAVSIIFWASKFILNRCFIKYLFAVIVSATMHYTAILCLLLYFIGQVKIKPFYYVVGITLAFLAAEYDSFDTVLTMIIPSIEQYQAYFNFFNEQSRIGMLLLIFLVIFIFLEYWYPKEYYIKNMMFFTVVISLVCMTNYPLLRVRYYTLVFAIVSYQLLFERIKYLLSMKVAYLLLLAVSCWYLNEMNTRDYHNVNNYDAYANPYISAGNIDYKFNFKLIE